MKIFIQRACFVYGCAMVAGSVVWLICVRAYGLSDPFNPYIVMPFLAIHGVVVCITLQRFVGRSRYWTPVLKVSTKNLIWARCTLTFSLGILVASILFFVYAVRSGNEWTELRSIECVVASMGVLSFSYIAVHWGLRPENIFGKVFIERLSNPLSWFSLRR
jgi:hypothetical protein